MGIEYPRIRLLLRALHTYRHNCSQISSLILALSAEHHDIEPLFVHCYFTTLAGHLTSHSMILLWAGQMEGS
jgi:hypothetical protein